MLNRRTLSIYQYFFLLFFWTLAILGSSLQADDWPHWRGPTRNGHSSESSGYRNGKWDLKESWQIQMGVGSSSPIIIGHSFYSFHWQNGKEVLDCRDVNTGEVVWSQSYSAPKYGRLATGDQGLFSGPCSTPEYDPQTGFIYTLGSDGMLICWDTNSRGKQVWRKSLYDVYDIPRRPKVGRSGLRDYGFTSSPLVYGKQLIVEVGAKSGNLVAYDKTTGKELWKSESHSPGGHNGGPVIVFVDKSPCVAVHNHDGLLVASLKAGQEGRTVADVEWVTSFANNIATVGVSDNRIIVTSAYNQNRMACFRIASSGATKLWENKLPSKICSPIIAHGKVYFCWRSIKCIDLETGKLDWEGESTGDAGSMILTRDKRLIAWTRKGDLTLIESAENSPGQLKILAKKKVFGRTDAWPHVVLANGRIYCKDQKGSLKCFVIAK